MIWQTSCLDKEGIFLTKKPLKRDTEKGLVMVITGNGKGKTTSAFGQTLRAVGQGYRVAIIQFMKGRDYGEVLALKRCIPEVQIFQYGLDNFVVLENPAPGDVKIAQQGWQKASDLINSGDYDMVVLDEINVVVKFGLISEDDVIKLITNKPPELDIILTGRYASDRIIQIADMVSEILEIKHQYNEGMEARAGIEY
jgi:cob(I)alamin adenosyltransferase